MAERLRRETRNLMGSPAQVQILLLTHILLLEALMYYALDGGYSGFVRQIVEPSDPLSYENFSYPVHKTRGMAMADQELHYNKVFGGFRSSIEGCFGDMQSTFSKFTHDAPIRFSDAKTFDLQFKLCYLLMNIKEVHNILDTVDETTAEIAQEGYKIAKTLDCRGEDDDIELLAQWKGFDVTEATWATPASQLQTVHPRLLENQNQLLETRTHHGRLSKFFL
ncbi:hypothetical protein BCR41DRAFT_422093 [Lobosporangium transversale]|uniref:Chromo domain-containing protein n=1 Tax=Lobosporangium transversale TaxID=64571 RepID=A0A1Y2GQ68_9FUNG|nr:hypothetical protein BCR41DRAFT_422093 [Lobosporangium transversale]ORZ16074.1 hypothetical protein BCR41DRAFT_422093 [Lobosporangium transversale]|eukprot:XP_021881421.1 hypothetical protein BCR41DRAFT_422093 [Lobosporangium transversale]